MKRLRILITNNTLASHAGSEVYARDLAMALQSHGHFPILFSTVLGAVAEELRLATIPVVDDLANIAEPPDLIHGQHHLETMTALLHFPGVPAVYFCHGWLPWEEAAPHFSSIQRYVAVDDVCFERLNLTSGIPASKIRTIRNAVNLQTFLQRAPLPERPKKALVFSNHPAQSAALDVIRSACATFGIEHVDTVGAVSNNSVAKPQDVLARYDLVFAKGRSALEALAVGCAVIVCDIGRLGEMVTSKNVENLRNLNFGVRTLQKTISEATLLVELHQYQALDIHSVNKYILANANFDAFFEKILAVYDEVLAETWEIDWALQSKQASNYIREMRMTLQRAYLHPKAVLQHAAHVDVDRERLATQVEKLQHEQIKLEVEQLKLQNEQAALNSDLSNAFTLSTQLRENNKSVHAENTQLTKLTQQLQLKNQELELRWGNLQHSRAWRLASRISQIWQLIRGGSRL